MKLAEESADFYCLSKRKTAVHKNQIEEDAFEKTHTVLYIPEADEKDSSLYRITNDFVTTAVRENQENAMRLILTKYNTTRK